MSELTKRLRAKYPGSYDDLDDAALEKAVLAKHPEYADLAGDQKAALPTRPVSPEDFAPEGSGESLIPRGVSAASTAWNALKSIPSGIASMVETAYNAQRPEDALLGPAGILAPLIRAEGTGRVEQAHKAMSSPTLSEAIGHGAAAVLPIPGTAAAAQTGEDIGSGDPERFERGAGNAIGMVAAPEAARAVKPALRFVKRAAPAVGRGAMVVAKESAPSVGAGVGAAMGGPAGAMVGSIAGKQVKRIFGKMLKKPDVATETPPAANAGGRIVKATAPSLESDMAAMLQDVQRELDTRPPPSRITTPPEPQLPAGFTPRSTVPKPKAAPQRPAAAAEQAAPKRAYFLRSPEEMAGIAERKAAREAEQASSSQTEGGGELPASWRAHTGQDIFPMTSAERQQITEALRRKIEATGLSPRDAIAGISKDRSLPTVFRTQLLRLLGQGQ